MNNSSKALAGGLPENINTVHGGRINLHGGRISRHDKPKQNHGGR